MPAAPLVGPFEGRSASLRLRAPGRLALGDTAAGEADAGWAEPGPVAGATALVRLSTAHASDAAVAEALASVLAQVREAGIDRVLLETDDDDRDRYLGGPLAAEDGLDARVVPPMRVTNSMGRRIERLVTLEPGRVGVYSCGPTVYSYQHLGNMRPYVFADTLKRVLRWRGMSVRHVINITDVGHLVKDADQGEDKVEAASRAEGRTVEEITGHYTDTYWADLRSLNVTPPDEWPRASDYVPQMINFAAVLEDRGVGYRLAPGLYFDTSESPGYGELAGLDFDGMLEGARVDPVEGKRNKTDFALWRTFTDGRERLMQWDSPWGVGAPGWHLECSVMSISLLGDHFDVHTGGIDHRELHHVNEIAQSEAYLNDGRPWVRYWMHNEFLNFGGAKMAKSAGGILRLADLVALGVHPLAYRYLLLQSHYGSQLAFTEKLALNAHVALKRLALRLRDVLGGAAGGEGLREPITLVEALDEAAVLGSTELAERILALDAAMADDLHTERAVAMLSEWSRDAGALPPAEWEVLVRAANTLTGLDLGVLGAADFVPALPGDLDVAWVEDRLAERESARAVKDWEMADRMRAELAGRGVRVEDTPEGTHWYVVAAG
ncbi:MAG TPA: cysteine--tRNA ligase [Acidimicrobiales bacterium]|nr:cysteine--tRNA ligase [Acidimicrobiales bacterium]